MKKILLLLFIPILLNGCYSTSQLHLKQLSKISYKDRLIIAVVDFQNKSGDPNNDRLMDGITGTIINELQNTNRFRLMERKKITSILDELKFELKGLMDPNKVKEVGKLLGVDALLFGNLSSVKYSKNRQSVFFAWTEGHKVEINLDARLVNVETGEILAASKSSSFIKHRNWVAFWFARLGGRINKSSIIQTGIDLDCRQLSNDIANSIPSRSDIGLKE